MDDSGKIHSAEEVKGGAAAGVSKAEEDYAA